MNVITGGYGIRDNCPTRVTMRLLSRDSDAKLGNYTCIYVYEKGTIDCTQEHAMVSCHPAILYLCAKVTHKHTHGIDIFELRSRGMFCREHKRACTRIRVSIYDTTKSLPDWTGDGISRIT